MCSAYKGCPKIPQLESRTTNVIIDIRKWN